MNAREFMEGLKNHYHEGLHPSEHAEKDMLRTLKAMKYTALQLSKIYDELLRNCDFFPKIYDVITHASKMNFVNRDKPLVTHFKTGIDDKGYCWAQPVGRSYIEDAKEYYDRIEREACSMEEGREAWNEGFAMATQDLPENVEPQGNLDLSLSEIVGGEKIEEEWDL